MTSSNAKNLEGEELSFTDSDGRKCDLATMCRREPEWAANRLRVERIALERVTAERDLARADYGRMVRTLERLTTVAREVVERRRLYASKVSELRFPYVSSTGELFSSIDALAALLDERGAS